MKNSILAKIRSYEDYAVELQRGLIAIPALSPKSGGNGEYDKAAWLEGELKKLPFDGVEWINAPQKEAKNGIRPNIVARYRGRKSNKTLWIMSHLDVVPPGERSLWNSDPYVMKVEGRKLIGRGAEDNHQAVTASMLTVKAMMECGYRPDFDIALLFCADEESGSGYGADYVMEKRPDIFGKDDMFLVPDGGNPEGTLVEIAEKSILWLKFRTEGKQCHASMPHLGVNSFRAASDLVVRLKSLYARYPAQNPLYQPAMSTFEPTRKEPNIPNINTIPGDDVFYFDSRVLPDYKLADVKAEMRRLADEVEKEYRVRISFTPAQEAEAAPPTPADAPVVKALMEAVKEIYRIEPEPRGIGGGTVAAFFRRAGLAAVVYSKIDETAHQPNEYCILDNLMGDSGVFALTVLGLSDGK
ncbi:MAG: M20 family metallo-hydrolase [bacterium]